jgi:hypothetical protein
MIGANITRSMLKLLDLVEQRLALGHVALAPCCWKRSSMSG